MRQMPLKRESRAVQLFGKEAATGVFKIKTNNLQRVSGIKIFRRIKLDFNNFIKISFNDQ